MVAQTVEKSLRIVEEWNGWWTIDLVRLQIMDGESLILSYMKLKNGQTYFKNRAM